MTNISYSYICVAFWGRHIFPKNCQSCKNENGNAKFYKLFEIDWREFLIIQGIFQRKSTKKGGNEFQWSDRVLFIVFPSHFSPIPLTPLLFSVHGSSRKKLLFDLDKLVWFYRKRKSSNRWLYRQKKIKKDKKIVLTYYNKLKKLTWLGWSFNVTLRFETFFMDISRKLNFNATTVADL